MEPETPETPQSKETQHTKRNPAEDFRALSRLPFSVSTVPEFISSFVDPLSGKKGMLFGPARSAEVEATAGKREYSMYGQIIDFEKLKRSGEVVFLGDVKKLKRSASSGDVTSSTDEGAAGPTLPLFKPDADDPHELNAAAAATQAPSAAAVDESKHLGSGWTLFRMLIPAERDNAEFDQGEIDNIIEEENAQICIHHPVDGVRVVMVWAKEDPHSFTSPAVKAFVRVHKYFMDKLVFFPSRSPYRLTRLLIRAEEAKSLIHSSIFQTMEEESRCFRSVYLTDNVSILSGGDVIIELQGLPERVNNAVNEIASILRQIPVDESMLSLLESQRGIRPPKGDSVSANKSPNMKAQRTYEVQHFIRIPFSYVDRIIGENSANVETLQQSSSVSIVISPKRPKEVKIQINGDSESDIEKVEELLERFIDNKDSDNKHSPVFEWVFRNVLTFQTPVGGEIWY